MSLRHGRRMVLVDVENLVGGGVQTVESAAWTRMRVEQALGLEGDEHVVIGTSHFGAVSAKLAWSQARVVMKSGQDGADLALEEVLLTENIAGRFETVVIVSGDGHFTNAVAMLARHGVHVTVAGWRGRVAAGLRLAASTTTYLDLELQQLGAAA